MNESFDLLQPIMPTLALEAFHGYERKHAQGSPLRLEQAFHKFSWPRRSLLGPQTYLVFPWS